MKATPELRYKYPLLSTFIATYGARTEAAKKEFCKTYNIHPSTVRKHFKILMGEDREITDRKLHQYARFLNISLQALKSDHQNFLLYHQNQNK